MLKQRRRARRLFDKTALKDRLFIVFTCSTFSTFLGYIAPYFYIPTYSRDVIGTSDSLALYMLVFSTAASFFGRLGSGILAHYLGSIVTWMLCALSSGILALCWISIETKVSFIAFSILWGMHFHTPSLHQIDVEYFAVIDNLIRDRFPFRWARYPSLGRFRKYMPGSLKTRNPSRNVLERLKCRVTHWSAYRGGFAQDEKRPDGLYWCTALEWSMSHARNLLAERIVVHDGEKE